MRHAIATSTVKPKTSAAQAAAHRTTATEKHYIPNYPTKLFIYKHNASKFWWVRYFVGNNAVRKSTKTTIKRDAIAFAKQFFDIVTQNQRLGINASVSATSFASCQREMMTADAGKLKRGEITKITYDNNKYRYDKFILPHFGKYEVRDIDYFAVERFLNELSTKALSTSTISAYIRLVRRVLVYASRRKFIVAVPEFPTVTVKEKPRGWFTVKEYFKLINAAKHFAGKTVEVRKYFDEEGERLTQYIKTCEPDSERLGKLMRKVEMTEDMRRLIVFMANSYIRPTDIKTMKHKHVDVVKNRAGHEYLRLNLPPSKGHSFPITTMPSAVNTYIELTWYHIGRDLLGDTPEEAYVFLPQYTNRDYALKQLQRQWEVLMHHTQLDTGLAGEQRTIYSLRHTAIMHRLIYGVGINTLLLARNARTSVEMIDRFYAKQLTAEMNITMLQSRRPRKIYDGEDEHEPKTQRKLNGYPVTDADQINKGSL
jgi:hypothetical protein